VRDQFASDPVFESISEEQERVRIFKEFRKTIKVFVCMIATEKQVPLFSVSMVSQFSFFITNIFKLTK